MALLGIEFCAEAVEFLGILGLLVAFTGEAFASVVGWGGRLAVGTEGEDGEEEEEGEDHVLSLIVVESMWEVSK